MQLLEYLAAENIRATFFQCGTNVTRHPSIAREIYAAGHEIGNHTYSHPRLSPRITSPADWRSRAFIYDQLARTQLIIRAEVGVTPVFFRAPYGLRWFGLRDAQLRLGLLGVMWTVIGRDWELPAFQIHSVIMRRASPGGIICLHDGRDIQPHPDISEMLKAVKMLVPQLKDEGYSFETVSEILQPVRAMPVNTAANVS